MSNITLLEKVSGYTRNDLIGNDIQFKCNIYINRDCIFTCVDTINSFNKFNPSQIKFIFENNGAEIKLEFKVLKTIHEKFLDNKEYLKFFNLIRIIYDSSYSFSSLNYFVINIVNQVYTIKKEHPEDTFSKYIDQLVNKYYQEINFMKLMGDDNVFCKLEKLFFKQDT